MDTAESLLAHRPARTPVSEDLSGVPCRVQMRIHGAVQGVGFRPFVYRLANSLQLAGWVGNTGQGVTIEVEGMPAAVREFVERVQTEAPPHAIIRDVDVVPRAPDGIDPKLQGDDRPFLVTASDVAGARSAFVLPDLATCADCRRDIVEPSNRRYRYPFTNCTNCGPRYTIVETLPYDRANTTMKSFTMCSSCRREYEDPLDRRFHAQPNACPACGPRLEYWEMQGTSTAGAGLTGDAALSAAVRAIREGYIVAVKGIGGFHLFADARQEAVVRRLRDRKGREAKPLAVMFPSLGEVARHCEISADEERLLLSPQAPIVLLRAAAGSAGGTRSAGWGLAAAVAPGNPYVGALLPYSPLHLLLLAELGFPVIATSGNLSDEPICIDEHEAAQRLGGVADAFLVHDRPIARQVDDSVVRVALGHEVLVRRARGYAPLPVVQLDREIPRALAAGGHLKAAAAISVGRSVFLTQHIGDLDTPQARALYDSSLHSMSQLYEFQPALVLHDAHPDYYSTRYATEVARRTAAPQHAVQHHAAHVLSCMAEHGLTGPVLGVAWDGAGYGPDGTIWGGEFLHVSHGCSA
ncbi:MAG TPA: carbamoyltransferase HypF, partial [Chloroflexota bacterium]|nr:carbamoyltransferase HypF [Chloroflexota bacterium]